MDVDDVVAAPQVPQRDPGHRPEAEQAVFDGIPRGHRTPLAHRQPEDPQLSAAVRARDRMPDGVNVDLVPGIEQRLSGPLYPGVYLVESVADHRDSHVA